MLYVNDVHTHARTMEYDPFDFFQGMHISVAVAMALYTAYQELLLIILKQPGPHPWLISLRHPGSVAKVDIIQL